MIFTETKLEGAFVIEIKKLNDDRGFFGRSWCANEMREHGIQMCVKQILR
jgi:dTDP-4-dehydrorhamnose 3,5-epimerase